MRGIFILWAAVTMAAGCGPKELSDPPRVLYGRDTCTECRMIIQDERFSAAAVSEAGRYLKFDDIGCLALREKKWGVRYARVWVSAQEGGWISRDQAFFAHAQDLVTPMGYGAAAFQSEESAKKFAAENGGRMVTWDEIKMEVVK